MASYKAYGGGPRDIGKSYISPRQIQFGRNYYGRGKGFGDDFRGVMSFLSPLLKSGSRAIGGELLKGGAEILGDIASGNNKQSLGRLIKEQGAKRARNLAIKAHDKLEKLQSGEGFRSIKPHSNLRQALIHGAILKAG